MQVEVRSHFVLKFFFIIHLLLSASGSVFGIMPINDSVIEPFIRVVMFKPDDTGKVFASA